MIKIDIFPKNPDFFKLFDKLANKVKSAGVLLYQIKINSTAINLYTKKARRWELDADDLCHQLKFLASSTFITPIDREDIYLLARSLDNIVDLIENVVSNINAYVISKEHPQFKNITKIIYQATEKISQLINHLKYRDKKIEEMKKLIIQINSLENKGDELMRDGLRFLFHNHQDLIEIVKWKDILEDMEGVLDECENTAYIVEEIIIKNF